MTEEKLIAGDGLKILGSTLVVEDIDVILKTVVFDDKYLKLDQSKNRLTRLTTQEIIPKPEDPWFNEMLEKI